jgi:O-antigen/teichoic acid export membrane protein
MIRTQILKLARQSLVYGFGGVTARIVAVVLLPIYTRYLSTSDYGAVALLYATESLFTIIFRLGVQNAFFRFYYLDSDPVKRRTVIRTAFWFTMISSTVGLVLGLVFAPQIGHALNYGSGQIGLIRATAVLFWADMNYQQQAAWFRAEQRAAAYAVASICNVTITVSATVTLIVLAHQGPMGLIVGNFTGTLCVYFVLLAYRARLLSFEFDRHLYHAMERFGLPLVPATLALSATRLADRFFISHYLGKGTLGVYAFGMQIAQPLILVITAFQLAWPAFAYSIEDDGEARHTYSHILTYYLLFMTWIAVGLSLLAPFAAGLLGSKSAYHPGARFVPVIAFSYVVFAGYLVVVIGIGRVMKTGVNWVVTGGGALLATVLNILLIPRVGAMGAAVALLCSYAVMFLAMSWRAHRLFPVPYQWRRVVTLLGVGAALVAVGKEFHVSTLLGLVMALGYPLALFVFGFYSAPERARMIALVRRFGRAQPAA